MRKILKNSYFALILAFIYIPILVMIVFSFNSLDNVSTFGGFSWKPYNDLFKNSPFIKSIITSLFVAVISTAISLVIGVSAAIGLSKVKKVTNRTWFGVANIPLINADIVTAVSLMIIFLLSGIQFGIVTLIMAHVSFNVPYVLITVMPRLRKIDKSIVEAANDLGAKPGQVLFKIILPILKPAIITAAAIAFAMSFDDFIISYFTGGNQTNVSSFIYTSAKRMKPFIYAFGTIMVLIIVSAIFGWNIMSVAKEKVTARRLSLKEGNYKAKKIKALKKELQALEEELNTNRKVYKTKNIITWIKYFYLKVKLRILNSINYDKKISRIEWKIYKLESEISKEKRYYSRRIKTVKNIEKLTAALSQETSDVKKAAKMTIQLEKLQERLEFLNEEIEWIENREEKAEKKSKEIQEEIDELLIEMKLINNKKEITWYNKKIKSLKEWKIEVEEGKNKRKLRMSVLKLKELKLKRIDKIILLNEEINKMTPLIFKTRSIINKNWSEERAARSVTTFSQKVNKKISNVVIRIDKIQIKIQNLNEKYWPLDRDELTNHTKGFIAKSWKVILASLISLSAFAGLTVAYVKNNIYDLIIANWGEYIDPDLITEFENENGVKINYQTYDSNETLYNKTYTFNYDLMVPSDYMVQRMVQEGKIQALDEADETGKTPFEQMNITDGSGWGVSTTNEDEDTVKYDNSVIELLKQNKIDGSEKTIANYCVPYLVGDLVIVVNTNKQSNIDFLKQNVESDEFMDENGQIKSGELSWSLIWAAANAGKTVAINNDPKNLFMMANEITNQKVNLTKTTEVDSAFDSLKTLITKSNVQLQNDELISTVSEGNFDFAVMYNGDALYANQSYNESMKNELHFAFGRPNKNDETTNVFTDNIVISKTSNHKKLAYKFIDFVSKHAAEISNFVGMTSAVTSAQKEVIKSIPSFEKLYTPVINDSSYNSGTEQISFKYNKEVDEYLVKQYNKLLAMKR